MIASIFTLLMLHFLVKWSLNLILGINIGIYRQNIYFPLEWKVVLPSSWPQYRLCATVTPPPPPCSSLLITGHHHYTVTTPIYLAPLLTASTKYDSFSVGPSRFLFKNFSTRGCPGEVSNWTRVACVRRCVRVFSSYSALSRLRTPLGLLLKEVVFSILTEHSALLIYMRSLAARRRERSIFRN